MMQPLTFIFTVYTAKERRFSLQRRSTPPVLLRQLPAPVTLFEKGRVIENMARRLTV
jgi:hypothetical protein